MTILTEPSAGDERRVDENMSSTGFDATSRDYGSIFARELIKTLTSSATPFLDISSQNLGITTQQTPLQPENPTCEQSEAFNKLCDTIHGILGGRMTPEHYECPQQIDSVLDMAVRRSLRIVAQEHADACVDDWSNAVHLPLRSAFKKFAQGQSVRPTMTDENVINTLLFRDDLASYTDLVVAHFNLPKAQGKTLLCWDKRWTDFTGALKGRGKDVSDEIVKQGLTCGPSSRQDYRLIRAHWYLAECISMTDLDEAGTSALVKDIKRNFDQKFMHARQKLMKSSRLRSCANDWLKSIGRWPAESKRASLEGSVDMEQQ